MRTVAGGVRTMLRWLENWKDSVKIRKRIGIADVIRGIFYCYNGSIGWKWKNILPNDTFCTWVFFITNVCGLGFLVIWIFSLERGWRYEVFSSGCVKGIIKKFDFLIYGLLSMRGTIEDLGGFLRGWVKGTITEICFLNILVTVFVICLYKTVAIWKT